jgi:hypothetical protein
MKVSDAMILFEMNRWHRFLFWCVNIPRVLCGRDLVFYPCMIGKPTIPRFKRAVIIVEPDKSV